MMPDNLFQLQLMTAFRDRRQIIVRLAVSVLLALPFILAEMPAAVQAGGIVIVIVFTGFFGAAVSRAQLRADARLARLRLLPVWRISLWLDLMLATMLTRLAPAIVIVGGFILVQGRHATPSMLLLTLDRLCRVLLLVAILGMTVGRLARNNAEVHLFGALTCGVLILLSGVAPVPQRLAWLNGIMEWNPLAQMAGLLGGAAGREQPVSLGSEVTAVVGLVLIAGAAVWRWRD